MHSTAMILVFAGLTSLALSQSPSNEDIVKAALKKAIDNVAARVEATNDGPVIDSQTADASSIVAQRLGEVMQEATKILVADNGIAFFSKLGNTDVIGLLSQIAASP